MDEALLLRVGSSNTALYLISDHDEGAETASLLEDNGAWLFSLPVSDWNFDLSPWKAERCFSGGEDFGGGAGEYLAQCEKRILAAEAAHGIAPAHRALCGYSLAGLCALYGLYVSDRFDAAVTASGSMWFDGWIEYMRAHEPRAPSPTVYLSVGDREKKTRNPKLCKVEDCTREAEEILRAKGAVTHFRTNPGNHFVDGAKRLALGMNWVCGQLMR